MIPSPAFRAFFALVAVAAALAVAGCGGNGFSAGNGEPDASTADGGPDGDIIVGPDGAPIGHDGGLDASHEQDARADAPEHDAMPTEAGEGDSATTPEAGGDGSTGCPSGYLDCMGTCTQEGLTNCGTCGHDCANLPHVSGTVTCGAGGVCTFTNADCAPGWAHCTGGPDNGCETSTGTSPNCGGCGVTCSGGMPVCNGTTCVSGCSGSTPTLCPSTNTCVNTTNDAQNCNGCGDVCPAGPANSTTQCSGSACGWHCNMGYTQCGNICVNEQTDPNNCQSCNNMCPSVPNGTPTCTAGACGIQCNAGLTYCPSPENACVNETNDPNNCNGCGNTCPNSGPTNSSPSCSGSTCGWTCNQDYEVCGFSCVLSVPDQVAGVFVAQGGPTTGCGTISTPCGTIDAALTVAANSQGAKTKIYLAESSTPYAQTLVVPNSIADITFQGGWVYGGGSQWTRPCALDPSQVVITSSGGAAMTFLDNLPATLDTLTLQTLATGTPGETLYGIFIQGGGLVLTLDNVDIIVAAGESGTTPSAPGPGASAGTPGSCGTVPGGTGVAGAGATNGTYSSAGYTASTGTAGQFGVPGTNGAAGTGATCRYGYQCSWSPTLGCIKTGTTELSSCGTNGAGGCGSGGSPGGSPGTGGGSSVGIFAWDATVNMNGVKVTTGNGGAGGAGGPQGAVQSPSPGTAGTAPTSGVPNTCSLYSSQSTCGGYFEFGTAGSMGGSGGSGGPGGQGGGGAGGDSFCYVYDSTSTPPSGLTCTPGQGGNPGGGGSPAAAAGRSGTSHEAP